MNQISISCMVLKSVPMAHCGQTRTFICAAHLARTPPFCATKTMRKMATATIWICKSFHIHTNCVFHLLREVISAQLQVSVQVTFKNSRRLISSYVAGIILYNTKISLSLLLLQPLGIQLHNLLECGS